LIGTLVARIRRTLWTLGFCLCCLLSIIVSFFGNFALRRLTLPGISVSRRSLRFQLASALKQNVFFKYVEIFTSSVLKVLRDGFWRTARLESSFLLSKPLSKRFADGAAARTSSIL
jgi:hypothetical protein